MSGERGSFGFFDMSYRIDDEQAVLHRKPLLFFMALLLPAGVWGLVYPWVERNELTRTWGKPIFLFGILFVVLGIRGLWGSPLIPPRAVRITRQGVQWGGRFFPAESVRSLSITSGMRIVRSRYGTRTYWDWLLLIDFANDKSRKVKIATAPYSGMPPDVESFAVAAQRLLPGRVEGAPQRYVIDARDPQGRPVKLEVDAATMARIQAARNTQG